jgi:hypothetical protein
MAITTGGALGIGAIAGGAIGANAYFQNRAARAQAKNARSAAAAYQEGLNTAAGKLDPYVDVGNEALGVYSGLVLGKKFDPSTGQFTDLNEQQRQDLFQKSPGYQFRMDQRRNALETSQAARGGLLGGRALKELDQYSQGIASQEYGNYLGSVQNLTGMGQNAATNQGVILADKLDALAGLNLAGGAASAQQYSNIGNMFGQMGDGLFQGLGAAAGAGGIGGTGAGGGGGGNTGGGSNFGFNTQLQSPQYNLAGKY